MPLGAFVVLRLLLAREPDVRYQSAGREEEGFRCPWPAQPVARNPSRVAISTCWMRGENKREVLAEEAVSWIGELRR